MKKIDNREARTYSAVRPKEPGTGPDSAGQSGDTQGLQDTALANSESIEELLEEGQTLEAEATSGVENAPDADVSEVRTRQVSTDDVPEEYLEKDQ